MDFMEVMHTDGSKGKITHEEAWKIAEMVKHDKEMSAKQDWQSPTKNHKNSKYGKKAAENIRRMAGWEYLPQTEDDLKAILYEKMPGWSKCQADLMYEIIEMGIALHSEYLMDDKD
jgi:hypothetical protein